MTINPTEPCADAASSTFENALMFGLQSAIESAHSPAVEDLPDLSVGSSLEFLGVTPSSFLSTSNGISKLNAMPKLPEASFSKKNQPGKKIDSAGKGWFNMSCPEITPEIRDDLRVLRNRAFLDPKRHYKRDGKKGMQIPKYFEIGTVIEAPHEFYSSRLANRDRHTSLARELLADDNVRSYMKRKAAEIVATRPNKKKLKPKKRKY